jgi:hypothetical protein
MRTLYNLPDGDVEDINKKVASQIFDDDQPNKSYLTISQVCHLLFSLPSFLFLFPLPLPSLLRPCFTLTLLFLISSLFVRDGSS